MAATLKAVGRTEIGSNRVGKVRKAGLIPGVLYGHGEGTVSIAVNAEDLLAVIHRGERLVEVQLGDKAQHAMIKDVQLDAMQQDVLHVDLTRVNLDEMVEVTVPVVLRGTPAGATEGGVLNQLIADVTIEVKVRDIPQDIRVSVAAMKVGDTLKLGDLPLPAGAKLRGDAGVILASVTVVTEEELAAPEEGPTQPEVIGEKKDEEGAAEEGKE